MQAPFPTPVDAVFSQRAKLDESLFQYDQHCILQTQVNCFSKFVNSEIVQIYVLEHDAGESATGLKATSSVQPTRYLAFRAGACTDRTKWFGGNESRYPLSGFGIMADAVARKGKISQFGPEVQGAIEALRVQQFSTGDKCHSILAIPIYDRIGDVVGVIQFANKLDGNGIVLENPAGDPFADDIASAEIFAREVFFHLEVVRIFQLHRHHLRGLHRATESRQVFDIILGLAIELLGADRGDLAVWATDQQDLVIRATSGPGRFSVGQSAPRPSIIRSVWQNQATISVADVRKFHEYFEAHPTIASELTVIWEHEGEAIGVLNLESNQLRHFLEHDELLLRILLGQVSIEWQAFVRALEFDTVLRQLAEEELAPQESLETILRTACEIYSIHSCLLYLVNHEEQSLYPAHWVGCNPTDNFVWRLTDNSMATHVFRTGKSVFFEDAWQASRNGLEGAPHSQGLNAFKILGAIAGIPLVYRGKSLGVLVVWHSEKPKYINSEKVLAIKPFASLAAAHIAATKLVEQRDRASQGFQKLQASLQIESSVEKNLAVLLKAVADAGFDRVRLFDYYPTANELICRKTYGMEHDPKGLRIDVGANPYAEETVKIATQNPACCIFDPVTDARGPDPNAAMLGKPPDCPWVVVPLVIGGEFIGEIAADNAYSSREIRKEVLNNMTLLGALASQVIATERMMTHMGAQSLPMLYDQLKVEDRQQSGLIRRLLIYITCGEVNHLAFSRALFFKYDKNNEKFLFADAVGSMNPARYREMAEIATRKGLRVLLEEADRYNDVDLEQAAVKIEFHTAEATIAELVKTQGPAWKYCAAGNSQLWNGNICLAGERIQSSSYFIVTVRDDGELWGLFLVDRMWSMDRAISEADGPQLAKIAQQAARVFRQHALYQKVLAASDLTTLGFMTKTMTHNIREPLHVLRVETDNLKVCIKGNKMDEADDSLERVDGNLSRIVKTVSAVETLLKPQMNFSMTVVDELFDQLVVLCFAKAESLGITLETNIDRSVPNLKIISGLLGQAILNLIANSLNALEEKGIRGKITLKAQQSPDLSYVIINVTDNGPGVAASDLELIQAGKALGSLAGKGHGLGLGLQIVRNIVEVAHGGRFTLFNNSNEAGVTACMWIPSPNGIG